MPNIIGIDLGTTFSCVGIYRNGKVEIIANEQGHYSTPSYVAFDDNEKFIGEEAKNQIACNPENTIFDAKRLIGRKFNDSSVQEDMERWPFKVVENDEGNPELAVNFQGKTTLFSPEDISSMIVEKMIAIAQEFLDEPVKGAVITIPSHFNYAQRKATRRAGELAGLKIIKLMNEPTAAAIAYGFQTEESDESRQILVVDIGGGTLDATILHIQNKVITVKSTSEISYLGGEDFTNKLIYHFVDEIKEKLNKDISGNVKAFAKLSRACEMAKLGLSMHKEVSIDLDSLVDGKDFSTTISRAKFQEMNKYLFEAILEPIRDALHDAGLEANGIDDVIFVGGSTRIPKIQQIIKTFFPGTNIKNDINPNEAVAIGAAIQATKFTGVESGDFQGHIISETTPLTLGIQWAADLMSVIIPKNTTIPATISQEFKTRKDNQITCRIAVYEGERPLIKQNNLIGEFHLNGITEAPAGKVVIVVEFNVDDNGILNVSAMEKGTQNKSSLSIMIEGDVGSKKVQDLLQVAEQFQAEDTKERQRVQAKEDLESMCIQYKSEFRRFDELQGLDEAMMIQHFSIIVQILTWIDSNPNETAEHYSDMKTELQQLCYPFRTSIFNRCPWMRST